MSDRVDILLATYEGSLYLKEQLQSLMQQNYPNFHILIRDDCSTDQTLTIIDSFRQIYPEHITLIPSHCRLGVKGNFSELMPQAQANYIMFCDQDDIWLPNKIELSLCKMKMLENQYGNEIPLLVHTDLQVMNSDLSLRAPSFWDYSNINPSVTNLKNLLVQNIVTGCAMMMNAKLLQLSYPIPDQSIMHDWWIALVAQLFGKIEHIEELPILYRQHGKNTVGAQRVVGGWWQKIKNRIADPLCRKRAHHILKKYEQGQELLKRYLSILDSSQKQSLHEFLELQVFYLKKWRFR